MMSFSPPGRADTDNRQTRPTGSGSAAPWAGLPREKPGNLLDLAFPALTMDGRTTPAASSIQRGDQHGHDRFRRPSDPPPPAPPRPRRRGPRWPAGAGGVRDRAEG